MSERVEVTDLVAEARALDPDRTTCVMLGEPGDRPLLLALVLLNAELARIPELVREPLVGMIRYQWWHDSLVAAATGRGTARVPLLEPLAAAFAAGRLDPAQVDDLVTAREAELDRLQPDDLAALEAFAAATSGALHRQMALACGGRPLEVRAALLVGTGFALVGLARAVGHHRTQDRVLLPADLLAAEAVTVDDILAARAAGELDRVTGRILERAEALLAEARTLGPFRRRLLPALLPARLARRQASRLRRAPKAPESRDAWSVPDLVWGWLSRRV